nr:hypothetical protein [Tanacetum cinerariifolium]
MTVTLMQSAMWAMSPPGSYPPTCGELKGKKEFQGDGEPSVNFQCGVVVSVLEMEYGFCRGLPSALFDEFHESLSVRCTPAPTAGSIRELMLPSDPVEEEQQLHECNSVVLAISHSGSYQTTCGEPKEYVYV